MMNRAMVQAQSGEPITAVERDVPELRRGEALLRMRASCLNYHDLLGIGGRIPGLSYPRVPLSDGCGEVVAVGNDVERIAVGDRVAPCFLPHWIGGPPTPEARRAILGDTCDGCLQQYLCIAADSLVKVPAHLSDLEAATLPCAALTAWRSVAIDAGTRAGDTVLVQGTGGVAIFALQFAKALGATVIVTSSSEAKLERAAALGADHGIDYRTTPDWAKRVQELTVGRGVDLVVEGGGAGTFPQSVQAAALGGHVSVIGVLAGMGDAELSIGQVMQKNLRIEGVTVGSRSDFEAMCRAIEGRSIRPVISDVFSMDEVPKGLDLMERGGHFGKIAIAID